MVVKIILAPPKIHVALGDAFAGRLNTDPVVFTVHGVEAGLAR